MLWDVKGNADVNLWIYVLYFVNDMYMLENTRGDFYSGEAQLRFITSKQSKQSKISTNLWNTTSSNEWIQHLIKGDRKFTFCTLGEILLFSAVSAWEWSNVVWQAILTRSQRLGDGQVLSEPCHFFSPVCSPSMMNDFPLLMRYLQTLACLRAGGMQIIIF